MKTIDATVHKIKFVKASNTGKFKSLRLACF